ncbi:hypothetical protein HK100_012414 [Physocladia obscura]|uniref:Repressor of RNA polymerase III transcription MAF1 n=1 Tax=Physocladia obscura TaxID=109957 RepID=A0AAD5T5T3_9FUNG|nr:hypothetical protein HK100_012414 [Physocladia obscura]
MYIDEKYVDDSELVFQGSPTHVAPFSSSFTGVNSFGGGGGGGGGSFGAGGGGAVGVSFLSPGASLGGVYAVSPSSPYGPLAQVTSRKTLFYLLATLNAAFPDYDFSDIKPELFMKIPHLSLVKSNVNSTLFGMGHEGLRTQNINNRLWEAIDEVTELDECDIYSFNPNPEVEPDSEEGNLWSFYYFFFNRKMKRIVFFTARAVSSMAPIQPEEFANDIYGDNLDDELMFDSEM